jgi:hypothetical protein
MRLSVVLKGNLVNFNLGHIYFSHKVSFPYIRLNLHCEISGSHDGEYEV